MKTIQKPWIKLKETMDDEDYYLISMLQEKCVKEDQTALKLELDYKLRAAYENGRSSCIEQINEFMYFDRKEIIGYIGICSFGGPGRPIEANGMVHPEYRRQGVFKTLSQLVLAEWKRRTTGSLLLLSDRKSSSGQKFIRGTGAQYKHSEYEMYLKEDNLDSPLRRLWGLTLRKATNADIGEITRQNAIYFHDEDDDFEKTPQVNESDMEAKTMIPNEGILLPEEEEKRGMTIYLAEKDRQIIGKVHLQLISGVGGIYGLGVLPEHRGRGFGRAILLMAIQKLKEASANVIMLQVAADNANALNLYKSCGFMETSTMDYYEIRA